MNEMFDIRGKKAIVTGGSRGLGREMAKTLYQAGAQVTITGTNDRIFSAAEDLSGKDGKVYAVKADFQNADAVERAFYQAIDHMGSVDILVNNAGMQIRHKSEDFPLRDWEQILMVNLTAPFILCRLAGKEMLKKGRGKIINTASLLSFSGGYTVPAYAASKGGIAQLTKALSNEWAQRGINVNAIAPGYMDTDNIAAIKADPVRNGQILERIPAGRYGTPGDLSGALIFLASKASDYVNGTILTVDGGWMGR